MRDPAFSYISLFSVLFFSPKAHMAKRKFPHGSRVWPVCPTPSLSLSARDVCTLVNFFLRRPTNHSSSKLLSFSRQACCCHKALRHRLCPRRVLLLDEAKSMQFA